MIFLDPIKNWLQKLRPSTTDALGVYPEPSRHVRARVFSLSLLFLFVLLLRFPSRRASSDPSGSIKEAFPRSQGSEKLCNVKLKIYLLRNLIHWARERERERERERIARAEKKKGWGWEEKDGEGGAHIIQDYFATRRFPILGKHLTLNHRHIDRNALYSKAIREGCYMYSKYKDDTRINFRRWSIIIFYLSVFCFSFFFFSKFFFPIFFVSLFAFLPFFLLLFCNVFVKYFKWFQNTKKKKQ